MTEWYDQHMVREQIDHDDVGYFVAEQTDDIRGYISGGPSGEERVAILGAVYVEPDYWGKGVGTDLLTEFEEFCGKQGYETILVLVLSENTVGASFYREHGYEVTAERETEQFGETVPEYEFRGPVE